MLHETKQTIELLESWDLKIFLLLQFIEKGFKHKLNHLCFENKYFYKNTI